MTSLDVAQATSSPRVPVPVTKRQCEWSGGVVSIKIPKVFRMIGTLRQDELEIPYAQFGRTVKGGVVNLFVHTDNADAFAGKEINAEVKIHSTERADGRRFLHVDLHPTDKPPTHRLIIQDQTMPLMHKAAVFNTPSPLQGMIALQPLLP